MTYTFKRRRRLQIFGCIALAALATIFLLQGLFMWPQADAPVIGWICIGIAALFYALLIPIVRETFTPGPMLVISPEGLLYRTYSPEIIPWSEISEVKLVRPPRRRTYEPEEPPSLTVPLPRRPRETEDLARMGVMFNVRDPSRYRASEAFAHSMTRFAVGMLGGVQIMTVQATTAEILAAIKTCWRGDIPVVDSANPFSVMAGKQ
jgi:hypothetical protein